MATARARRLFACRRPSAAMRCVPLLGGRLGATHHDALGLADLVLDLESHVRMRSQELAGVVLALANAIAVVAVPRARFLDDVQLGTEIDDLAFSRNAFAIEDVEGSLAERRRHLVLDDLDLRLGSDDLVALLDRAHATNIQTHGGIELQR